MLTLNANKEERGKEREEAGCKLIACLDTRIRNFVRDKWTMY